MRELMCSLEMEAPLEWCVRVDQYLCQSRTDCGGSSVAFAQQVQLVTLTLPHLLAA